MTILVVRIDLHPDSAALTTTGCPSSRKPFRALSPPSLVNRNLQKHA